MEEYLREKISKLSLNNPVLLIDSVNSTDIYLMESMLMPLEEVKIFTFGKKDFEKNVILKKHINGQDESIIPLLDKEAINYYKKGDYLQALYKYLEIILISNNPKPPYYRMLAYTYLHLNEKEKAIMYFKIAEGRSQFTKNKYRFKNLINKISK